MPVTMFNTVDLPLPEGPTMDAISPCLIAKSMPRRAGWSMVPVR